MARWGFSWGHFSGFSSMAGRGGDDRGWLGGSGVQGSRSAFPIPLPSRVQGTGHSMSRFWGVLGTPLLARASSCQPSRAGLQPGLLTEQHCSLGAS